MRIIKVCADVRYTEDADIKDPQSGVYESDECGDMPCLSGTVWTPEIDVDRGVILNWKQGVEAKTHYKVCDCFAAKAFDGDVLIAEVENEYVPDFMCPDDEGFGDYLDMTIHADGTIENWKVSDFEDWLNAVRNA